jgi:hypothetical protein
LPIQRILIPWIDDWQQRGGVREASCDNQLEEEEEGNKTNLVLGWEFMT